MHRVPKGKVWGKKCNFYYYTTTTRFKMQSQGISVHWHFSAPCDKKGWFVMQVIINELMKVITNCKQYKCCSLLVWLRFLWLNAHLATSGSKTKVNSDLWMTPKYETYAWIQPSDGNIWITEAWFDPSEGFLFRFVIICVFFYIFRRCFEFLPACEWWLKLFLCWTVSS